MKPFIRKFIRIFGFFLLSIILLIGVLLLVLQFNAVQTFIAKKVVNAVSEKTGVDISLGKVAIRFLDNVQLEEIYLADSHHDTLLYAGKLRVDINLFHLIKKEAKLDHVLLQNAVLNLEQYNDTTFNFQSILDSLSSGSTGKKKKTKQNDWQLTVGKVDLKHIQGTLDLAPSGFYLKGFIGDFSAAANTLDLNGQQIDLDYIKLNNSEIAMKLSERDSSASEEDTTLNHYLLPDIGWVFSANNIDFANNMIALDDESKTPAESGFDPVHFKISGVDIEIKDAFFGNHTVKADVKNVSAKDTSGVHLKHLEANVLIDTAGIRADQLKLQTDNSMLAADLKMLFPDLESLVALDHQLYLQADFSKSTVAGKDVTMFIPGNSPDLLKDLDTVNLDGEIEGAINDISGKNFTVRLDDNNYADLTFHATGLPGIDTTYFELNMKPVSLTPGMISKIAGISLPAEVQRLHVVTVKGQYTGTIHQMKFNGSVTTRLGDLSADLQAQFNEQYSSASYSGNVHVSNFRLGTMLNDTSLGQLTLQASINGSGLSMENLHADLQATIKEVEYRNYTYNNLKIDGKVNRKQFNGKLNINDPNVSLHFDGLVNLNDSIPVFRFQAAIDTVNLGKLNLVSNTIGISTNISVDFQGMNINDFQGYASIKDINLSNDSIAVHLDSIKAVTHTREDGNKEIDLTSPIINGKLSGDYNVAELPQLMFNYVNDYFPINLALDTSDVPPSLAIEPGAQKPVADQKFELQLSVNKPMKVLQIFLPQLSLLDTASITGSFDSREKSLDLTASVPKVGYSNIEVNKMQLKLNGGNRDLIVSLHMDSVNYSDKLQLPLDFSATMYDDKMDVAMKIKGDSLNRLAFNAKVIPVADKSLRLTLNDGLKLNGEQWSLPAGHYVDYHPGVLTVNQMKFTHGSQQLSIATAKNKTTPVEIAFHSFSLNEISDLADYDSIVLNGIINGSVTIDDTAGNLALTSDLNINGIEVNDNAVGDLALNAAWQGTTVSVDLRLQGKDNDLTANGTLAPEKGTVDMDLNMKRFQLAAADPFLHDYIRNSKGYVSADLNVEGKLQSPDIKGYLAFHDVSTKIVYANTRFTLPDKNRIMVSPGKFELNQFEILDQEKRKAVLNGKVTHHAFSNFKMDLSFDADHFLFMNTTGKNNDLFYGKVIMSVHANVKGPPDLPVVNGRASTQPGTQVFINPLAGQEKIEQADFIVFQSPPFNEPGKDTAGVQEYKVDIKGVDMNLLFELTPESEVQIVIDPASGDKLVCKGSADLVVDVSPAGGVQISGSYIVESGSYNFSYQGLLKRQFEVQKNSRINFSGDLMNAVLDVTAVYTVEATTYELIAAQSASLSSSEVSAAQKRTTVNVLLKMSGKLSEPEISFDIKVPSQGNPVTSIVARQLAEMRQNPTEMNKQVFALLLFRSFMSEEGSNPDLASAGENVALRSVSKLVSNQLNKLAGRAKGFEINLDLQSYKSKYETEQGSDLMTQVGVDVSKQLLNDRLELSVGGNLNLENSTTGTGSNGISNITGDFTVEYKLTENGRYRVKVFQTSDYDVLNQSSVYRTGAGLTYHESFRNLLKRNEKNAKGKTKQKKE